MILYSRTGAVAVDDPEHGHFEAGDDGAFDLPHDLATRLHGFAVGGRPLWETGVERQRRLAAEEAERRRDPQTLLAAVEQLVDQASRTEDEPKAQAKRTRKPATPKPDTGKPKD